jgi:hypothetical protein
MKTMKRILLAAVVLVGFTTAASAQATATASATAIIVTPISIAKATGGDLHFGNIATNGTGGTVVVAPSGARSFGTQGGLTFPAVNGSPRQASFDVSGTASYTYAITLPGTVTLTHTTVPANTMSVASWTTDATVGNAEGQLDGSGADNLNIGATLTVGNAQAAGTYTNASFSVTVNYN